MMSMTDIKPIKANVRYKEGNKWKERIAILKRLSPVSDCLFIFLKKFKTNTTFEMEICLREMCGMEVSTRQKGFVLHIICLNAIHTFDFLNAKIRDLWMSKIKNDESYDGIKFTAILEKISVFTKLSRCNVNIHIHRDNVAIATQQAFKSCVKLLLSWKLGDIKKHGLVNDKYYIVLSSYNSADHNIITLSHLSFTESNKNDNVINNFTFSLTSKQPSNLIANKSSSMDIKFPGNKLSNLIESRIQSRKISNYMFANNLLNHEDIYERGLEYAIISSKPNISNNISSSMESNYSDDHPRHFSNTLPHPVKNTFRRFSVDEYFEPDYVLSKHNFNSKVNQPLNNDITIPKKKTVSCLDLSKCKVVDTKFSKMDMSSNNWRQAIFGLNEENAIGIRLSKSMDELQSVLVSSKNFSIDSNSPKLNIKIKMAKTSLSSDNYLSMSPSELSPSSKNIKSRNNEGSNFFLMQRNSIDLNGYAIMTGRLKQESSFSNIHLRPNTICACSDSNLRTSVVNDSLSNKSNKMGATKKLDIFRSFRRSHKKLEMIPSGRDIDYWDTGLQYTKDLSYSEGSRRKFLSNVGEQKTIFEGDKVGSEKLEKKPFSLKNYLPGMKYLSEPKLTSVQKYNLKQPSMTIQRPRSGKEYSSRLHLQNNINSDYGSIKKESQNHDVKLGKQNGTPIFRSNFFKIAPSSGRTASFDAAFISPSDEVIYSHLHNYSLDSSDGEPIKDIDHINYERIDVSQSLKHLQSIWSNNGSYSNKQESMFSTKVFQHSKPQLVFSKSSDFINDSSTIEAINSKKSGEYIEYNLFTDETKIPKSDDAIIYAQIVSNSNVIKISDPKSILDDSQNKGMLNKAASNLKAKTSPHQDLPPRIKPKSSIYQKPPSSSRSLPKSLYRPTNLDRKPRHSTMPITNNISIPSPHETPNNLELVEYASINFSTSQLAVKMPNHNKNVSSHNFIESTNSLNKSFNTNSFIKKNINSVKYKLNDDMGFNSELVHKNRVFKLSSYATLKDQINSNDFLSLKNENLINKDRDNNIDVNYTRIDEAKTKALSQAQRR